MLIFRAVRITYANSVDHSCVSFPPNLIQLSGRLSIYIAIIYQVLNPDVFVFMCTNVKRVTFGGILVKVGQKCQLVGIGLISVWKVITVLAYCGFPYTNDQHF